MEDIYYCKELRNEAMYYEIMDDVRKRKRKYVGSKNYYQGEVKTFLPQEVCTKVSHITSTGLPLIEEFKSSKNKMFGKKFRIMGVNVIDFTRKKETRYVEAVRNYLRNPELLAFIMPNGYFVLKEKEEEELEDVAKRLIRNDAELTKKYKKYGNTLSVTSNTDFMINEVGAIAIVTNWRAIANVSKEFKNNIRRRIWLYVILNTDFIKVHGLLAV